MCFLRICFMLLITLSLRGTGTIAANPALPFPNTPVTFILTATSPPIGPVSWNFGNGQITNGGTVAVCTYPSSGMYVVRATYRALDGQGVAVIETAQCQTRVADLRGPSAPFSISGLRLRWENGNINLSVPRNDSPLVAFLDIQFEGTGLLQLQWTVDGMTLGVITEQLSFAGVRTLDSSRLLSLPTLELGEHVVSVRILEPQTSIQLPQIRYYVTAEEPEPAPRADTISPSTLHAGDEAEIWITGKGLKPGVKISFGKDIAVVSALRFPKPGTAVAKVFIAPNARTGIRQVAVRTRSSLANGPARLQILSAQ